MKPTEPILFNLNYTINGQPTDCGISHRQVNDETVVVVCANIEGQKKEFILQIDDEVGNFKFTSPDVPAELLAAEDQISAAVFSHDA